MGKIDSYFHPIRSQYNAADQVEGVERGSIRGSGLACDMIRRLQDRRCLLSRQSRTLENLGDRSRILEHETNRGRPASFDLLAGQPPASYFSTAWPWPFDRTAALSPPQDGRAVRE